MGYVYLLRVANYAPAVRQSVPWLSCPRRTAGLGYRHAGCLQLSHVRTADPFADGCRSAASRTAIGGTGISSRRPRGDNMLINHRGRLSAIFAFFFMFCSRLSALISVLCDIFTVELAAAVPLTPPEGATVDFTELGTTGAVFPDFCGSVFPTAVGRVAEKAPPPPQPVDGEILVSELEGLVGAGELFASGLVTGGRLLSDLERDRSDGVVDAVADRLLRFLARLARPASPRPDSDVSFTTVG